MVDGGYEFRLINSSKLKIGSCSGVAGGVGGSRRWLHLHNIGIIA